MRRFLAFLSKDRVETGLAEAAMAPLARAQCCLDQWLREEDRRMSPRHRQRATALIARYFDHEEDASDQLILSFLRHYSGLGAVDLDDPQMVRQELKAVLDRAPPSIGTVVSHRRLWLAAATGMLSMGSVLVTLYLSQQTLTMAEQDTLKGVVAARAVQTGAAPATIWAGLKREFHVARYQQIRRWDFEAAKTRAQKLP